MKRFRKIYLEITNRCNLHCDFCLPSQRPKQDMTLDRFTDVLTQIHPYSDYLYLHVLGEPLCHPHLDQLLEQAAAMGFSINMTTNGILLPQHLPLLCRFLRQCNISLHSFPQQPHSTTYLTDCLAAGDVLAANGVYVSYRFWNQLDGTDEPISTAMIKQMEAHYQVKLTPRISQQLADHRYIHFDHPFQWPSLTAPMIAAQGSCYGMRSHCAILVDGTVVPCCLDGEGIMALGNVFQTPFAAIIDSDKAKQITTGFQQRKLVAALCRHCDYRRRFDEEDLC